MQIKFALNLKRYRNGENFQVIDPENFASPQCIQLTGNPFGTDVLQNHNRSKFVAGLDGPRKIYHTYRKP